MIPSSRECDFLAPPPATTRLRVAAPYLFVQSLNRTKPLPDTGFSKVQGSSTSSARGAAGDGEKCQWQDSELWEFKHPKFRRGCKELLECIKRHKDDGHVKRRRGTVESRRTWPGGRVGRTREEKRTIVRFVFSMSTVGVPRSGVFYAPVYLFTICACASELPMVAGADRSGTSMFINSGCVDRAHPFYNPCP